MSLISQLKPEYNNGPTFKTSNFLRATYLGYYCKFFVIPYKNIEIRHTVWGTKMGSSLSYEYICNEQAQPGPDMTFFHDSFSMNEYETNWVFAQKWHNI